MLVYKFPTLFSIPNKNNLNKMKHPDILYKYWILKHKFKKKISNSLPTFGINPNLKLNYIDYNKMFRKRKDYKETLIQSFDYLKKLDVVPWLDLDMIWNEHMKRKKDYGVALQVLLGLAANLNVYYAE